MPAKSSLWWWSAKGYWATQLDGKRITLAKGKRNKRAAQQKLDKLLAERELLSTVDGPISVAALCEQFLDDAYENLVRLLHTCTRRPCGEGSYRGRADCI